MEKRQPRAASSRRGPPRAGLLVRLLFLVAVVCSLAPPATGKVRLRGRDGRVDLILIGFGVFQTNLSEEVEAFFDSGDDLPPEFQDRQVLNLRMDGRLGETMRLDARLVHDRENLRDWRYLVRLEGERSYLAAGELDGAFDETTFTRYDTPYYGVTGRLALGAVTATTFATTRSGARRVDRLRGTNLSGPYVLSASPVLEGSERVVVEVRDRLDVDRVLRSDRRQRGRDYEIDYPSGSLRFAEPIESETFDGDPVQIVVEYEYATADGGASDVLIGTRVEVQPARGITLATTALEAGGDQGTLARSGLIGADQKLALGWLDVDNEMVGPGGRLLDRRAGAWRLTVSARPSPAFEMKGRYRRVGADFPTETNPRLDSELDREEWQLDGSWQLSPSHRLRFGYGSRSDNVAGDPAAITTRTRTLSARWEGRMAHWPLLRLGWERRLTDRSGGGADPEPADTLDQWTLDLEDDLGRWPLFGPVRMKAQYRLEREDSLGSPGRSSHSLRARLDGQPSDVLEAYLEARSSWTRLADDAGGSSSGQELLAGATYDLGERLQAGGSLRRRWSAGTGAGTRTTAILDVRFRGSERISGVLGLEWTRTGSSGDRSSRQRSMFGRLRLVPLAGLTADLSYEIDRGEIAGEDVELASSGEYRASLQYDGIERLTLFAAAERGETIDRLPPLDTTRSIRDVFNAGASWDLDQRWRLVGQIRDERLADAADTFRRALVFEVSRELLPQLRLGTGVEVTLDEGGDVGRLRRQRLFLKLVGQL